MFREEGEKGREGRREEKRLAMITWREKEGGKTGERDERMESPSKNVNVDIALSVHLHFYPFLQFPLQHLLSTRILSVFTSTNNQLS